MKTRISRAGSLLSIAFVVAVCVTVSESSVAEFGEFSFFHVVPGRNTNTPEHDNAIYLVYMKPGDEKSWGMLFVQTQGDYAYQPFECTNTTWEGHPKYALECIADPLDFGGYQLQETVTIGEIGGNFCKEMRCAHNPPDGSEDLPPIMLPSDCYGGSEKCSCYEIIHKCRKSEEDKWDEGSCPGLARGDDGAGENGAFAPPDRGAGSGGSN